MIKIILIVVAVLVVGELDYQDELQSNASYCDMVNKGYWPNYKKINC